MSAEGGTPRAGISSAGEGFKWYSCGEGSICGLAGDLEPHVFFQAPVLSAERCFHGVYDIPYETWLSRSLEPLCYA